MRRVRKEYLLKKELPLTENQLTNSGRGKKTHIAVREHPSLSLLRSLSSKTTTINTTPYCLFRN